MATGTGEQVHEGQIGDGRDRGPGRQDPGDDQQSTPWWRSWLETGRRAAGEVRDDNVTTIAASVAFYGMLAVFPALIAVVSVYGLVADPRDVRDQIESFTSALPDDASRLVTNQLDSITRESGNGLGVGVVLGILAALWTAAGGVGALVKGLNLVYDETETRPFWRRRGLALLLTLGGVVSVVVMLGLIVAAPPLIRRLDASGFGSSVLVALRWPLLVLMILFGLALLYRYGPNRRGARWHWMSAGALVAALIWVLASIGFSIYVDRMGTYNETYGSLGAVIVLMLWLYIAAFAVLFGAELNSQIEHDHA
ncbi:MAG TPA: YihY/virulence factor BrkB family protein [Acidimicrobiia bacterium]